MTQPQKPTLTLLQFEVIAYFIRSRDPARTAARMVLVEGHSNTEAVAATSMTKAAVSNAVSRFRKAHLQILDAYRPPE